MHTKLVLLWCTLTAARKHKLRALHARLYKPYNMLASGLLHAIPVSCLGFGNQHPVNQTVIGKMECKEGSILRDIIEVVQGGIWPRVAT